MLNVLIAESEELELGGYEVIGVVGSESEAREIAASDMARRERILESGGDPGICPYAYKMFQRGMEGYSAVLEISADTLTARGQCGQCGKVHCDPMQSPQPASPWNNRCESSIAEVR